MLEYKVKRNGEIPVIFLWFIQSPALRDMPLRAVGTKGGRRVKSPLFYFTDRITLSQQGCNIMPTTLLLAPLPLDFQTFLWPSCGDGISSTLRCNGHSRPERTEKRPKFCYCCCFLKYCPFTLATYQEDKVWLS